MTARKDATNGSSHPITITIISIFKIVIPPNVFKSVLNNQLKVSHICLI